MPEGLPVCSRCGAAITGEELAGGLAVRIDGTLTCPLCVDGLPSETRQRIERARAVAGLPTVTYRMGLPSKPNYIVYTFTTSGAIGLHRRALSGKGRFHAPRLPGQAVAARRLSTGFSVLVLGAATVAVVMLILWLVGSGADAQPVQTVPVPVQHPVPVLPTQPLVSATAGPVLPVAAPAAPAEPPAPMRTRQSFDIADPVLAWRQSQVDPAADPALRSAITDEARAHLTAALRRAAGDRQRLLAIDIPGHADFQGLTDAREAAVRTLVSAPPTKAIEPPIAPAAPAHISTPSPVQAPQIALRSAWQPTSDLLSAKDPRPNPWPVASLPDGSPLVTALARPRRDQVILTIQDATAVSGGGLVLMANRNDTRRKSMLLKLTQDGKTRELGEVAFANPQHIHPQWEALALDLSSHVLPQGGPVQVHLSDSISLSTRMCYGPGVLVAGRRPSATDLVLRQVVIGSDTDKNGNDIKALRVNLKRIEFARKGVDLDLRRVRVLAESLQKVSVTALRGVLATLRGEALPDLSVTESSFTNDWLKPLQIAKEYDKWHVLVVLDASPREPQWLSAWSSQAMSGDARGRYGGVLPVLAWGAERAGAPPLPPAVAETCARLGVPCLDLSSAQGGTVAAHLSDLAGLLREGLLQLDWRLTAIAR